MIAAMLAAELEGGRSLCEAPEGSNAEGGCVLRCSGAERGVVSTEKGIERMHVVHLDADRWSESEAGDSTG
jgi:hypothetical protein